MLPFATVGGPDFGYSDALVALLTVETLAFAALAAAVALTVPTGRVPDLKLSLQLLGKLVAAFVTVIAVGSGVAWLGLFHRQWPYGFYNLVISLTLAIAIVAQPTFAWVLALALKPKE